MSFTIVSDTCEGVADCIPVCPVECIHWADGQTNAKGTRFTFIDPSGCIDCGACLSVCPIEDAILDEWKPELQRVADPSEPSRALRPQQVEPNRRPAEADIAPGQLVAFEGLVGVVVHLSDWVRQALGAVPDGLVPVWLGETAKPAEGSAATTSPAPEVWLVPSASCRPITLPAVRSWDRPARSPPRPSPAASSAAAGVAFAPAGRPRRGTSQAPVPMSSDALRLQTFSWDSP